ncbi:hypothetical protein DM47_3442 [Burkholderia mallei]|nr:hypothetical protein DM46_2515 [Burkholderia mallei]KOT19061.1 hypothetical protein DM47_3442 [Burkholderia mallei]
MKQMSNFPTTAKRQRKRCRVAQLPAKSRQKPSNLLSLPS